MKSRQQVHVVITEVTMVSVYIRKKKNQTFTKSYFVSRNRGHGIDVDKALDGCDAKHATILLAHQPKAAKYALDTDHDIQLVLAGE